jgi:hypothetical protein
MLRVVGVWVGCFIGGLSMGCQGSAPSSGSAESAPAGPGSGGEVMGAVSPSGGAVSGGHAAAGAAPGSHEDWCGEHQVAESMCTRCNGSLIPAFKATGDWCPEHGLPESQCLACNPTLKIERPPKKAP